jgi:hypothetical protein
MEWWSCTGEHEGFGLDFVEEQASTIELVPVQALNMNRTSLQ